VDVPLASTFMLSTKAGKEAYVEPVIVGDREQGIGDRGEASDPYPLKPTPYYLFTVKVGKPKDAVGAKNGTKLSRGANFQCLMSGTPIAPDYIKAEGMAGRIGARLMAVVVEGDRGRIYLSPSGDHECTAAGVQPIWAPDQAIAYDPHSGATYCVLGGIPFSPPTPRCRVWTWRRRAINLAGMSTTRARSKNSMRGFVPRRHASITSRSSVGQAAFGVLAARQARHGERDAACISVGGAAGKRRSQRARFSTIPTSRFGLGSSRCGSSPARSTGLARLA